MRETLAKPQTRAKTKSKFSGLKPKDRPVNDRAITGNQWQATPQQVAFMSNWLDPKSETFGNAYQSALSAGYSPNYADKITAPAIKGKWIKEFDRLTDLTDKHVLQGITDIATNSKNPETSLKGYITLAKIKGMMVERHEVKSQVVKISLDLTNRGQSVDKPLKINNKLEEE